MKKRKLLTDIFTIVLMAAIVIILLAFFNVFPGADYTENRSLNNAMLLYVGAPMAILSLLLIDLVFPLIDNRARLSKPGYVVKVVIKCVLFVAAIICGVLFFFVNSFEKMNDFVKAGIFCALFFAEFMINLDPPLKKSKTDSENEEGGDYHEFVDDDE